MDAWLPKTIAHRFTVRGVLWRAPETVVVSAFDDRLAVPRALKLVRPDHRQNVRVHQGLHTEARVLTMVSHPRIVRAFDLVDDNCIGPVLVMPQIQGTPLDLWLADKGRLSPSLAVRLVSDVLAALQCCHDHSVVHERVDPAAVLLGRDGRAQLMELGRASIRPATPSNIQSDLQGVAALLFQLLAGHAGTDLPHASLDPSLTLWSALPDALAPVVRRGCHPSPRMHYTSASAMAADLTVAERQTPRSPPPRRAALG